MDAYKVLPAFDDVTEGLARAKKSGFRMFAFSNGSADAVETLLKHAGIAAVVRRLECRSMVVMVVKRGTRQARKKILAATDNSRPERY